MATLVRIAAYLTHVFYGEAQARIHHERFGALARDAAALILERLTAAGFTPSSARTVVDLGCGSGIYAACMADAGYHVVGVDISAGMLEIARRTAPSADLTLGSVHDFPLPRAVAITALGEVLNYATDARAGFDALTRLAARAREALEPDGTFVFDVSTPGRGTYERFHDGGDWALGMHSTERDDQTLERDIVVFTRGADGTFVREDERHELRLYEVDDVHRMLEATGFSVETRENYGGTHPVLPGWCVFIASSRSTPR
jgi:SAM-dependent methyltransferase